MKVLVTGGTGFVGRHLVKTILQDVNNRVVIMDNLSNSSLQDFYEFLSANNDNGKGDRLTFYQVDVRNEDDVYKILKNEDRVDVCIHLAAKVSVIDSLRDPSSTFDVNVTGTQNVLSSASRVGTRSFVFASSAAVYGKPTHLPAAEGDPTDPISPYGKSKLHGERLVQEYSGRFKIARSLRIFNVYGTGQTKEYAGVITKFADRISNDKPPIIYGDGNQTRDFISIDDVTRSIRIATGIECQKSEASKSKLRSSKNNGNIFNVGTGTPTTITGLAELMIDIMPTHRLLQPTYTDVQEGEVRDSFADTLRAYLDLGFKYRYDLRSGLLRMLSGP